eukprot:6179778-Pleurochrysis_carterae.AAC.1
MPLVLPLPRHPSPWRRVDAPAGGASKLRLAAVPFQTRRDQAARPIFSTRAVGLLLAPAFFFQGRARPRPSA